LDGREVDVGLEKGQAHFAEGFLDVFFGQTALAAQVLENLLDFLSQLVEHLRAPLRLEERKFNALRGR
jgi:hypothetical protein